MPMYPIFENVATKLVAGITWHVGKWLPFCSLWSLMRSCGSRIALLVMPSLRKASLLLLRMSSNCL
eukprot:10377145-Ditylum_brightwellii.AAC.1